MHNRTNHSGLIWAIVNDKFVCLVSKRGPCKALIKSLIRPLSGLIRPLKGLIRPLKGPENYGHCTNLDFVRPRRGLGSTTKTKKRNYS